IAMLAISVVEAATALPCHLSHDPNEKPRTLFAKIVRALSTCVRPVEFLFNRASSFCGAALDRFGDRVYLPVLHFLLRYPLLGLSGGVTLLLITVAVARAGYIPINP